MLFQPSVAYIIGKFSLHVREARKKIIVDGCDCVFCKMPEACIVHLSPAVCHDCKTLWQKPFHPQALKRRKDLALKEIACRSEDDEDRWCHV